MGRIRTVKPEVAKHEALFALEQELQVPVRFAWVLLPGQADREGRFKWRPNALKTDILPYDQCDFSRVLDAWVTRGFLVRYRVGHEWFGWIPTFRKHQSVNNKEAASILPSIDEADEVIDNRNQVNVHASGTRESRESDASRTRLDPTQGERKGREGKGREYIYASTRSDDDHPADPKVKPGSDDPNSPTDQQRLMAVYPEGAGRVDWIGGIKAAVNLVLSAQVDGEPVTWRDLIEAAGRYAVYCEATNNLRTQFVMQPRNFFGAVDEPWRCPWTPPPTKAQQQQTTNVEAGREWLARQGANDA